MEVEFPHRRSSPTILSRPVTLILACQFPGSVSLLMWACGGSPILRQTHISMLAACVLSHGEHIVDPLWTLQVADVTDLSCEVRVWEALGLAERHCDHSCSFDRLVRVETFGSTCSDWLYSIHMAIYFTRRTSMIDFEEETPRREGSVCPKKDLTIAGNGEAGIKGTEVITEKLVYSQFSAWKCWCLLFHVDSFAEKTPGDALKIDKPPIERRTSEGVFRGFLKLSRFG